MSADPNWATYLAHEIEWVHALERARSERRARGGPSLLARANAAFDPLAATCLAELIENRVRAALTSQREKDRATAPPSEMPAEFRAKLDRALESMPFGGLTEADEDWFFDMDGKP